jgi:hypothetical protein
MTDTPARTRILEAVATEARRVGLKHVTRSAIAAASGVPVGSISHVMGGLSLDEIRAVALDAHPGLADVQPGVADRDERILQAAVALTLEGVPLSHESLRRRAGVSKGTICNYGAPAAPHDRLARPMQAIRDDVMRRAVRDEYVSIVRAGLAASDPIALAAPADLRARAMLEAVQ